MGGQLYAQFRDRFAAAMDPAFYTIEYLDWLVRSGGAQIAGNDAAAIVFNTRAFPGGARAVNGIVAAGDIDEIKALIEAAEEWGRANGCTHAMIESRGGWERALRAQGYAPFQVAIMKEL